MWEVLLFLCVSVLFRSNAQETKTVKENSYNNRDLNGDFESTPVTITIRSGRNENLDRPATQNSGYPQYYSRDWDNLRVGQSEYDNNREPDKYLNGNDRSLIRELFSQRPNSEANNTLKTQYIRRKDFPSEPVPIIYFQNNPNVTPSNLPTSGDQIYEENRSDESIPTNQESKTFDLYRLHQPVMPSDDAFYNPSQSILNWNVESLKPEKDVPQISSSGDQRYIDAVPNVRRFANEANSNLFNLRRNYQNQIPIPENLKSDVKPKRISFSAIPINSDSMTHRTTQELTNPLSTENRRTEELISTPTEIDNERYLAPMLPAYFPPYHFHPYQTPGTLPPQAPYRPNGQIFDRETGLEAEERIPGFREKHTLSHIVPENSAENLQTETTSISVPSRLPYAAFGAPFIPYPLPFAPPTLATNPAISFPFGVPGRNVPQENQFIDQPPLPIVPVRPVPSVPPPINPVLPPIRSDLVPEEQTSVVAGTEVNTGENLPVEEPTPSKIPYVFGFDMNDGKGNDQHRNEVSDISGVVTGSYGFKNAFGHYRMVHYVADKNGFHAFVESNEPGVASSASADVVVEAKRHPLKVISEGGQEDEILTVPVPETELIAPGSIPANK